MSGLGVLLQGYGAEGMGSGLGDVADAFWPTTGDIDTATNSLAITIQELGTDIFNDTGNASDDSYQAFLTAWDAFVADFDQWKDTTLYWNPTRRDELIDYRKRFNDLLSTYQGFSGSLTVGVKPVPGDTPSPNPLVALEGIASKVVAGVVIVGALYAGVKAIGLVRSFKTTTNPRRRRRRRR